MPTTISFHTVDLDNADLEDADPGTTTDGRRNRRIRNRDRVVDEFIEFVRRRGEAPDTEQLAEVCDLSVRSIYRYFASHDELLASVAERLADHAVVEFDPGDAVHAGVDARVTALVDDTLRFHHRFGPAAHLVSMHHSRSDVIDGAIRRIHAASCELIGELLAPELAVDEHRDDTVALIGMSLTVGALTLLTDTLPGKKNRIRGVLRRHISAQIAPGSVFDQVEQRRRAS